MSANTVYKLPPEVLDVLKRSEFAEGVLRLPPGQLEPSLYKKVDKAISLIGGKWNRIAKGHLLPTGAAGKLEAMLVDGEIADEVKLYQFYPTPPSLALQLANMADIHPGHVVLEPSVGQGVIAKAIRQVRPNCALHIVDVNPAHQPYWPALSPTSARVADFLTLDWRDISKTGIDRIVANPPFTKGQDVQHVSHMLGMVKAGGRVVSVMAGGFNTHTDKKTNELRNLLDDRFSWSVEKLPPGSFSESGTNVSAVVLIADTKAA